MKINLPENLSCSPWAVLGGGGGFLGFLETPWGSPRFFPSFYLLQNALWPHVYPMWLSASSPMDHNSCRPPDPVQTQLSSIPVQQADAEPPEKQRQIQVMAQIKAFFWCPTIHFSFMQHVTNSIKS